jgi:hypothetical protein
MDLSTNTSFARLLPPPTSPTLRLLAPGENKQTNCDERGAGGVEGAAEGGAVEEVASMPRLVTILKHSCLPVIT